MPRDATPSRKSGSAPTAPVQSPADSTTYTPAHTGGMVLQAGGATVQISRQTDRTIQIEVGRQAMLLSGSTQAADVTRWCTETAAITDAQLNVSVSDELDLRTPMLLLGDSGAIALSRHISATGSVFRLMLARSAESLVHGTLIASIPITVEEARSLLRTLTGAAA